MTVQFLGVTVEFFGWYFNAHLLKHDFCSQFSRLADKETAEGRHLLSPSGITEPKFRAFSMTRSCRVNSSPPVEQFHFLFRSRGLGKRGILFPFPVHVSQRGGKYYFRFRWKFGGKGSTRDTEGGSPQAGAEQDTRGLWCRGSTPVLPLLSLVLHLWVVLLEFVYVALHLIGFKCLLFLAPPSPEGSDAAVHKNSITLYTSIYIPYQSCFASCIPMP